MYRLHIEPGTFFGGSQSCIVLVAFFELDDVLSQVEGNVDLFVSFLFDAPFVNAAILIPCTGSLPVCSQAPYLFVGELNNESGFL